MVALSSCLQASTILATNWCKYQRPVA